MNYRSAIFRHTDNLFLNLTAAKLDALSIASAKGIQHGVLRNWGLRYL